MTSNAHDDPLIGRTLQGRWRIRRRLGGGGMGTVYLAEQISVGGRPVALKVLHDEYSRDPHFVSRFQFEAEQAGRINDPRIVTVYDFGQAEDGKLFLVMEYVVGKTLMELVREGPLPLERAVKFGIQLAEALRTVHAAGIVHRDVKGDNAIVREGRDELKLMDFGIAKPTDDEERSWKTHPGLIVGTPRYMAPEQIEHGPIGPRTDIYAWGIVFYEMLTGDAPFSAPTATSLMLKHLQERPGPIRAVRPEVSVALERVILSAIEKRPTDRPHSMEAVVETLERIDARAQEEHAADPPVAPTAVIPRGKEQPAGRRWPAWAGAAVMLGLLGAVVATWFGRGPSEPVAVREAPGPASAVKEAPGPASMEQPRAPGPQAPQPRLPEHLALARFFLDLGEYDDAIGEYEAALAIDPGNAAASKGIERARRARAAERALRGE